MQTVNFQCGHCGNLMAVSTDYLGQQVRCPTCQQVVVAPPPEPAPAPPAAAAEAPIPHIPTPAAPDHEDIFSPPEAADDDLFGRTAVPRLEIPRDPVEAPAPAANGAAPDVAATLAYQPPEQHAPEPAVGDVTQTLPGQEHHPSWMDAAPSEEAPHEPAEAPTESPALKAARRASGRGGGWFIPLVFMPLLLYAVLMTVWWWNAYQLNQRNKQNQPQNLFERIPEDSNDDSPKARHVNRKAGDVRELSVKLSDYWDMNTAKAPLPDDLRVRLNPKSPTPLRIGQLEVTPLKVERRKVGVFVEGFSRSEPGLNDSLVLYLKLKNISTDVAFIPLDNFFDRQYRGGGGLPPLTALQMGDQFFFGGPAKWTPKTPSKRASRGRRDNRPRAEWIDGPGRTQRPIPLKPGKEMTAIVCTDGGEVKWDPKVMEALEKYGNGPLLWRIHLRRGLIPFHGYEVSATAVIGVEFTTADIEKPKA